MQSIHKLSIAPHLLQCLESTKNLLAFSGGIDSSALFFVLQDYKIDFDIAIVDYGKRAQSKEEVRYAQRLAKTHNKICHIHHAPKISANFELEARKIRYDFFYSLLCAHEYKNLLTAHHFDDRLEWFFMRLTEGSGLNTLLGFEEKVERVIGQKKYYIIRPFIHYTKKEILRYNHTHKIPYFHDASNDDAHYKRNFFRKNITTLLSDFYADGLKKSFLFLEKERAKLYPNAMICADFNLFSCRTHAHEIHTIDLLAKQLGYVLSGKQKEELQSILSKHGSAIMGNKIVIAKNKDFIFVGLHVYYFLGLCRQINTGQIKRQHLPYALQIPNIKKLFSHTKDLNTIQIPKKIRELYRIQKIPPKVRPLLYINSLDIWGE